MHKKKDAQQCANELRYLIDNGKSHEVEQSKNKIRLLTLSEVSEALIIDWEAKLDQEELKPISAEEYIRLCRKISTEIGKDLLCKFTTESVEKYLNKIAKSTSKVNSNRHLFIIKQIFKKGKELNAIVENVVSSISDRFSTVFK